MFNKIQYKKSTYLQESCFLRFNENLKIGIYGGSFNPPHLGHLYIAKQSVAKLNLNMLIWLVTPLNPLKMATNTLSLTARIQLCKNLIGYNPKIKITALEESFSHCYSYFTLNTLKKLSKNNELIWIMGEDNLNNFHTFKNWQDIIKDNNIAVFARGNSSYQSLLKKSSLLYKNKRISYFVNEYLKIDEISPLQNEKNNYLKFFLQPKNSLSSTLLRTQGYNKNNVRTN